MKKIILSALTPFLLIVISCGDDDPSLLTVEDIEGIWTCTELFQDQCPDPENNGAQECSDRIIFNLDFSCIYFEFMGTYTLENNLLTLTLDLSEEPIGNEGETAGIVELDPIEISLNKNILILQGTTTNIEDCYATVKYSRAN